MASPGWSAQGTKLQITISASPTDIPGVTGISGPTGGRAEIDITDTLSTGIESVGGLPDFGEISFDLLWNPAQATHVKLYDNYKTANTTDTFTIVCSDAGSATITFSGWVKGWNWSFAKNEAAKVAVTVRVSGAPTVTP